MIVRLHLHTLQTAAEVAAARGLPTCRLLSQAITREAIAGLTELDLRPEAVDRAPGKKGKPRHAEPCLAAKLTLSDDVLQCLRAAAKRFGCPQARIYRALADRFLGGCLHAAHS